MAPLVMFLKNALRSLHQDERAQDAFEYLLVIGGVSVAIIVAMTTPIGTTLIDAVIVAVCNAIDLVGGVSAGLEIDGCATIADA
jgi:Flp pilus assembly pilin Flp